MLNEQMRTSRGRWNTPLYCQDFSRWLVISLLCFCAWTGCLRRFHFFPSLSLSTSFSLHFSALASSVEVSRTSRPPLPAVVLVLGARPRPVTKDTGHPIGCVCRNSSPGTWLTALFTVYKLVTWGPLWTSWNSIWHSVLPVWEVWVPSCSSKGWDPKNIGKK